MIVVNAVIEASREAIAALTPAILAMETASLAEAGCEDYRFAVELANPEIIRITERWVSKEVLQAHFATPHMAAFQKAMAAHPPRSVKAHFYEATEIDMPR
ncbi:MAG: antibiotic biosynthesis monooxygenase [Pseudomonadales bacterium]|nr:antibiotic biosynthesis monooxygenase [Pseudomonadales bacterium]MCP5185666.1 antibiotic biosynthesis monooxygenase [Pseudomonadales bacterium]